MKNNLLPGLLCSALVFGLGACQKPAGDQQAVAPVASKAVEEKVLYIFNWSDYIDPEVVTDFTKETGIKVVYDTFDSSETLESHLLAGNSGYDIVVPGAPFLGRQIKVGVFRPLDKSQLKNWGNLDTETLKLLATYDPGNQYAIPYMWGTTGIGYDVDKVQARLGKNVALDSYEILFKPENLAKLKDCGISFLDAPGEVMAAALNYLGKSPASLVEADYEAAEKLLTGVRPYVTNFNNMQANELATGDVCVALGWSGDIAQAAARATEAKNGIHLQYAIPREGTEVWIDTLAIPTDAPHPGNATRFIDYIMRPEVAAKITNFVAYPSGNAAALKWVLPEITSNPAIYPGPALRARLYTVPVMPDNIDRIITRSWTRMKTGH